MKKRTPKNIDLIKCKHGLRPWSIVCVHLLNGSSRDWNSLPQDHGRKYNDWLCFDCLASWEKIVKEHNLDDVRPVCVDCVERIRREFDFNYKGGL